MCMHDLFYTYGFLLSSNVVYIILAYQLRWLTHLFVILMSYTTPSNMFWECCTGLMISAHETFLHRAVSSSEDGRSDSATCLRSSCHHRIGTRTQLFSWALLCHWELVSVKLFFRQCHVCTFSLFTRRWWKLTWGISTLSFLHTNFYVINSIWNNPHMLPYTVACHSMFGYLGQCVSLKVTRSFWCLHLDDFWAVMQGMSIQKQK